MEYQTKRYPMKLNKKESDEDDTPAAQSTKCTCVILIYYFQTDIVSMRITNGESK